MRKLMSQLLYKMTTNRGKKYCSICQRNIPFFLPHPQFINQPKLVKELDVIGSDLINYMCPSCHSHDRERHLVLFIKHSELIEKIPNSAILHFAPEKNIPSFISSLNPKIYIKCDLYPLADDVEKIDMQSIQYEENKFDLIIANHVMEHVNNDSLALKELNRVLKPSGYLILQTPFSNLLSKTIDDPGISTNYLRTQINGQSDHLRLYGKDIFQIIESFGFKSRSQDHNSILPNICSNKYGVNPKEPFMIFEKRIPQ